jgi:hypothetical protein
VQNSYEKSVEIHELGVQNTKELFSFCLDLMCKGLVLLFGTDGRVCINDITMEQFAIVKRKMRLAGIACDLEVIPVEEQPETLLDLWTQNFLNIQSVRTSPDNMGLNDYTFELQTVGFIYKIKFDLIHNVKETTHNCVM